MIIFVISPVYPNELNPMYGTFVQNQVELLACKYNKIIVINPLAFNYKNIFSRKISTKIRYYSKDNIYVYQRLYFDYMQLHFLRKSQSKFTIHLKKLLEVAINDHGYPDIVHLHFGAIAAVPVLKYFNKINIPVIITEHQSVYLRKKMNKRFISDLRFELTNSKTFITVSNTLKISLSRFIDQDKIIVINNTIDFENYATEIGSSIAPSFDIFTFFTASNLIKSKNVVLLVSQFFKAFVNTNVMLRIAGDGVEKKKIERFIQKNNVKNVILLGRLNRDEMYNEYNNCNCYVSASKVETFGITYREAMIMGKPVVAIYNDGIAENWSDDFGLLVKEESKFYESLKKIITCYDKYNSLRISSTNKQLYNSARSIEKIMYIYSNALNTKREKT